MSEQRVAARRDTDQAHRAPRSHDAALATRGLGLVLMLGVGALGYWFAGSVLTSAQPVPLWATLWVVVVMLLGSLVAGIAGIVMLWMAGAPRAALAGAPHTRVGRAPRSAVLVLAVGLVGVCLGLIPGLSELVGFNVTAIGAVVACVGFAWACAAFTVVFRRAPAGYWPPTTWAHRARAGLIGAGVLIVVIALNVLDAVAVQPAELNPGFTLAEIEAQASLRDVDVNAVKDVTQWAVLIGVIVLVLIVLSLWPSRGHRPLDDLLTPRHVAILTAALVFGALLLRWWFAPMEYFDMQTNTLQPVTLTTLGTVLAFVAHAALVVAVLLWATPKPEWAAPSRER